MGGTNTANWKDICGNVGLQNCYMILDQAVDTTATGGVGPSSGQTLYGYNYNIND